MLGWVVVTQSLHGTQKCYWMLERSGNWVWSQPPRQAVETEGTRCFLLQEKDNFWRNSFTPFRSHNSSAWNVLGTAPLPWFNNQVLTMACQALPLWHFLLLSPVLTPLKPRWALHYSSMARHIPASQSCSTLALPSCWNVPPREVHVAFSFISFLFLLNCHLTSTFLDRHI